MKPEHAPYRISGGRIRIGGAYYGIAAEIADPAGWTWTVLESMDGTRSVDEIVNRTVTRYPAAQGSGVRTIVDDLIRSGYVEDAGGGEPPELTARDKDRHDRARRYYRWLDLVPRASTWEPQARLRTARVTVLGVGGTGGVAALALAAAGVGRLHCIDPDTVELSNLSRQIIYAEDDIGKPKADRAVEKLRSLNSDITVSGERLRVESADDVAGLLASCDVLLLAADQPPDVRVWTNRACLAAGRPWVDAGYHGPTVQVGVYQPGTGGCWECLDDASMEQDLALGAIGSDASHAPVAVSTAVASVPAGISGYLAAHQVISLITGVPPARPGVVSAINLAALGSPFTFTTPPRPDCPACAGRQ